MKNKCSPLYLVIVLTLTACADADKKAHYTYPDDKTHYILEPGDANQYLAEVLSSSGSNLNTDFPTHEIEESWDIQISNLTAGTYPSEVDTSKLIVKRIDHDINELQSQFKTLYFQQLDDGEIKLLGLERASNVYWLKNVSTNEYGITYLPADPGNLVDPVSETAKLELCNNSCLDKGNLDYSLILTGTRTSETVYATFETVILDITLNVTALGDTEDISYSMDSRIFYTPLIGKVSEAVSFNDGQKSLFADYNALLTNTNISIDSKYILE